MASTFMRSPYDLTERICLACCKQWLIDFLWQSIFPSCLLPLGRGRQVLGRQPVYTSNLMATTPLISYTIPAEAFREATRGVRTPALRHAIARANILAIHSAGMHDAHACAPPSLSRAHAGQRPHTAAEGEVHRALASTRVMSRYDSTVRTRSGSDSNAVLVPVYGSCLWMNLSFRHEQTKKMFFPTGNTEHRGRDGIRRMVIVRTDCMTLTG